MDAGSPGCREVDGGAAGGSTALPVPVRLSCWASSRDTAAALPPREARLALCRLYMRTLECRAHRVGFALAAPQLKHLAVLLTKGPW